MTSPLHITAHVALGANLGQPQQTLRNAITALAKLPGVRLQATSSLYRTAPIGLKNQPDFINAVVALELSGTPLPGPQQLLDELFAIEARFGRQRSVPNAPRTLDLDLLLYDSVCCHTPTLTLPHPRMHQRAFVLAPLLEIAPGGDLEIPGLGSARTLWAACANQTIERLTT